MSGNAQFDLHPDAESLNAFAEHALADQERERIAAHLAICGRCREVVFLAQGAVEEMTPVAATVARKVERERWYTNWRLTWIPAAALAASVTVAYVIHVQRLAPPTQMAQVERQAAPAIEAERMPAPPPPAPQSAELAKGGAMPEKKAPVARTELYSAERKPKVVGAPLPAMAEANKPLGGDENALQASADLSSGLKPESAGAVAPRQRETVQVAANLAAKQGAPVSAGEAEQARDQLKAAAPVMQAEAASRSTAVKLAAKPASGSALVSSVVGPIALPGGSVTVSTATSKGLLLAVNEAGNVYLSSDMGAHWQSVAQEWSGRAVSVRTAAKAKTDAADVAGAQQDLFELVNDQGKVWVSADGRSWKAR